MWAMHMFIAPPIFAFFILLPLWGSWKLWKVYESTKENVYPEMEFKLFSIGSFSIAAIAIGIAAITFFPYEKEYHYYEPTSGIISSIDSRIMNDGDGMSEKFVVRFEGSNQEYGCTDTRCAAVEVGDDLTINCIRQWEFNGSDGWNCKWNENRGQ